MEYFAPGYALAPRGSRRSSLFAAEIRVPAKLGQGIAAGSNEWVAVPCRSEKAQPAKEDTMKKKLMVLFGIAAVAFGAKKLLGSKDSAA